MEIYKTVDSLQSSSSEQLSAYRIYNLMKQKLISVEYMESNQDVTLRLRFICAKSAVAMALCLLSVIATVLCRPCPCGRGDTDSRQQRDFSSDIYYSSQR